MINAAFRSIVCPSCSSFVLHYVEWHRLFQCRV